MISTAMKLGYVDISGAGKAYIREYDSDTLTTRVMVNGNLIDVSWNGSSWVQVQEISPALDEEEKFATLNTLTAAMYVKWLKKNIRQHGRRFVVGDGYQTPVEAFIEEMTGYKCSFFSSGDLTVDGVEFVGGCQNLGYYIFWDEDTTSDESKLGYEIRTAGDALRVAEWEVSTQKFVIQH